MRYRARPDVKIVDVIDVKGDPRAAFDKAQVLLGQTGPKKIDGFVCLDSASGKMVSDAIARAADKNRVLVAWDVNPDTLDGIKAGTIDATIAQKPYTMGYVGLKALDEVFHYPPRQLDKDYCRRSFSHYPVFIDTGTSLVDKNNVDVYSGRRRGAQVIRHKTEGPHPIRTRAFSSRCKFNKK